MSLQPCATGQVLIRDASTWQCASPGAVVSVAAIGPLSVGGTATEPLVSIAQAGSTSSGYLSSTDWTSFNTKYGASTQCGGDLSGTLAAPVVTRLQTRPIAPNEPGNGQVLKWSATTTRWEPSADLNSGGTVTNVIAIAPLTSQNGTTAAELSIGQSSSSSDGYLASADFASFQAKYGSATVCGGDLDGTLGSPIVAKLQGIPMVTTMPFSAQVLRYDGSRWAPASLGITDVGGLSGGYLDLSGDQTLSGVKTFSSAPVFSMPLGVGSGGTGATGLTGIVHGNGAGAMTAGVVDLATEVAGTLGISNGGTGSTSVGANLIFASPASSTGAPGFRSLVLADIPTLDATKIPSLDTGKVTTGTLGVARGGTGGSSAPAAGTVLFGGSGGVYAQGNAALFWDNANGWLGVGTSTPTHKLDVQGGDLGVQGVLYAGSVTTGGNVVATGSGRFVGDGSGLTNVVASGAVLPVESGTETACTQGGALRWTGSHFQGCTGVYWANLDNVPPPGPTTITPSSGPTIGGGTVVIAGSNFQTLARVFFGATESTTVTVQSATQIVAAVPAGVAGAVDVKVANPDFLSGTIPAGYTYLAPAVSSVTPNTGSLYGGAPVTVSGSAFLSGCTVKFGSTSATTTYVNSTTLTAVAPAGSAGPVAVSVVSTDGVFGATQDYTYSKYGAGTDGSATVGSTVNMNTQGLSASSDRNGSNADGVAFKVASAPSGTTITASGTVTGALVPGDVILLMDLQGTSSDYASAGNWELLGVAAASGSTITTASSIQKSYSGSSFSNQKVIVQRVPQYSNVSINSGGQLAASAWDGLAAAPSPVATGIVAFFANGTLTVGGSGISVSKLGFRGGVAATSGPEDARSTNITSGGGQGGSTTDGACGSPGGGTGGRGGRGGGSSPVPNGGHGGGAGRDNGNAGTGSGRCSAGGGAPYDSGSTFGSATLLSLGGGSAAGGGGGGGGGCDSGAGGGGKANGDGGAGSAAGGGSAYPGGKGGNGGPGGRGGGIVLVYAATLAGSGSITADGAIGGGGGGGGGEPSCTRGSGAGGGGGAKGAAGGTIVIGYGSSSHSGTRTATGGAGGGGGGGAGAYNYNSEPAGGGGGAGVGGGGGAGACLNSPAAGPGGRGGGDGVAATAGAPATAGDKTSGCTLLGGRAKGGGGGATGANGGAANTGVAGGANASGVNGGDGGGSGSGGGSYGNGGGGGGGAGDPGTSGYVSVAAY